MKMRVRSNHFQPHGKLELKKTDSCLWALKMILVIWLALLTDGEVFLVTLGTRNYPCDWANSALIWLSDCFEFVDLAVTPLAQGSGLGRELTKELFSMVTAKTAILLTHQTTTKASEMYLRNGWVRLSENFEVAPGKFYQIMGKEI